MMCPVCKRDLAATLSICFTCGAMVNDSVREELELKIGRVSDRLERSVVAAAEPVFIAERSVEPPLRIAVEPAPAQVAEPSARRIPRGETNELGRKKTSPTLVGFQPKVSTVPDWRLQLQNAIRQRKTDDVPVAQAVAAAAVQRAASPAPSPKARIEQRSDVAHDNPRVAAALRRIETSRQRFMDEPVKTVSAESPLRPASRNYPFDVVSRGSDFAPRANAPQATVNTLPKPRLVTSAKAERKRYDTNKLPPIPAATAPVAIEIVAAPVAEPVEDVKLDTAAPVIEARPEPKKLPMIVDDLAEEYGIIEYADDDDLAAIPSRFLAGLFDSIIGGFAAGIVLSPFLVSGGDWLSVSGAMTIMAVFGIVMFAYMTTAIGLRGRTVGMRLFGIEVVDAEENEYPTMHQAAVSSAVYLLSLPMLGLGFVPVLFNEERRAAHDLISGTVLVREI